MSLKVGCCGWAVKGGMEAYFREFSLIELQSTFYRLPDLSTAIKWREMAPSGFEFSLKSWQAITHPVTSPTWRKAKVKIDPSKAERYGYLKPTSENFEAWSKTLEIALALRARVVVVQLPPSMDASNENVSNLRGFFSTIDRRGVTIGVEFRHSSWRPEVVSKICRELDVVHIVDPFKDEAATKDKELVYYRLHGLGERVYVYDYSDEELAKLWGNWVKPLLDQEKQVYVLFNNTAMAKNAKRLLELCIGSGADR
ncbi:MAG: DUF72 domain-containing protein [Candidatus Nezhaarchaeota archaeon]|nr:DUF72 domain-containing protein [Candidatus Nezhaarchaeota archaeon]